MTGWPRCGQRPRQPLDVDRQPADVGPIVGQDEQDLHANNSGFARTQSISRAMPSRTLTCGAQPNSRRALLDVGDEHRLVAGPPIEIRRTASTSRPTSSVSSGPNSAQIDSVLAGPPPRL